MHKFKKVFLILFLFLILLLPLCFIGCSNNTSKEIVFNSGSCIYNDNRAEIKLKCNPTTGYQWIISDYNKDYFTIEQEYKASTNTAGLVGSGGNDIITITPNNSVTVSTQFNIEYKRNWEDTSNNILEVKLSVENGKINNIEIFEK